MKKIRPIAIYLPQFHPIPENDVWWGKGFTEWRNVVKAKPRFKGHYQPHLPSDLGFYDLRLEEARLAQETLAKQYGISGFCYYHYWFNGKRLLNEPIDRKIKNPKEDLPFMFCWANENWTRIWDGGENEVLIEQEYSHEDDINHINHLIPYFKDNRYIKVDGKPVFAIYKDVLLPDISNTLEAFRSQARKHGIELYLCRFERIDFVNDISIKNAGFDASIEFQPFGKAFSTFNKRFSTNNKLEKLKSNRFLKYFYLSNYLNFINHKILKKQFLESNKKINQILQYSDFVNQTKQYNYKDEKIYPCVSPGWDNASRRINRTATIFNNSTPELFYEWTYNQLTNFKQFSMEENFIFINAWNEWAEGNHLEPCEKWGHAYLEAFLTALNDSYSKNSYPTKSL